MKFLASIALPLYALDQATKWWIVRHLELHEQRTVIADFFYLVYYENTGAAFSAFTGIFNTTGQPAMSVPAAVDGNGLPVGVQFAGRSGDEALLFRLAAQLEGAMPWPTRPVVPAG